MDDTLPGDNRPGAGTIIGEILRRHFAAGVALSGEALHFAASSLGMDVPGGLMDLGDDELDDTGLAEIILHPPVSLSLEIEPHLPGEGLDARSLSLVAGALPPRTELFLAEYGLSRPMALTRWRAGRFLARLRLDAPAPDVDRTALAGREGARLVLAAVAIRRARFPRVSGTGEFLRALAANLAGDRLLDDDALYGTVEAVCAVLGARGLPPGEALTAEWAALSRVIEESERFAGLSRRYSMEFLMTRRVQPPAMGADEARRRMDALELAAVAGLGRPVGARPVPVREMALSPGGDGIDDLLSDV